LKNGLKKAAKNARNLCEKEKRNSIAVKEIESFLEKVCQEIVGSIMRGKNEWGNLHANAASF